MAIITEVAERLELDGMHHGADTSGCPIKCIPDLIRKRAYQLFEDRGRRQGHELDDWLQAEREIKHHLGSPSNKGNRASIPTMGAQIPAAGQF